MSGWSKELRTVLGIVLVGFSAATLATLVDQTPSAVRQALPDADLSQKLPVSAKAIIASHTIGLEVALTHAEKALGLMETPTLSDDPGMLFSFEHLQSLQFSVEPKLAFNPYHFEL